MNFSIAHKNLKSSLHKRNFSRPNPLHYTNKVSERNSYVNFAVNLIKDQTLIRNLKAIYNEITFSDLVKACDIQSSENIAVTFQFQTKV